MFTRYEFITSVHGLSTVLFVHDIEYLRVYAFRYKTVEGSVYHCCNRSKCKAKVIIDSLGICKQHTSASHSHPSVRNVYENELMPGPDERTCKSESLPLAEYRIYSEKVLQNIHHSRKVSLPWTMLFRLRIMIFGKCLRTSSVQLFYSESRVSSLHHLRQI